MCWTLRRRTSFSNLLVGHRNLGHHSLTNATSRPSGTGTATVPAKATDVAQSRILAGYGSLPLSFEPNQGQADARVKFLARDSGYTLFLTPTEAVLSLRRETPSKQTASSRRTRGTEASTHPQGAARATLRFATLRIGLKGANSAARVVGVDELPGKSNYLLGNDPAKWHTQIPTYARVKYENVYPGIDLVYHGNQAQLEL